MTALRWWVTARSQFPQVVADEPAYLAMARLLGGGPRWELGNAVTYGPAYSLLIAPWFALHLEPDAIYRAAVLTNAVLGGATFVALEALARRVTTLIRPATVIVAAVAASLPALLITSNRAWSDNLTPLCFALLVLALMALTEAPSPGRAGSTVAAALFGCAAHGRFVPLLAVVLASMAVLGWQRRLARSVAASAAAATVAGYVAINQASSALYDRLYAPGGGLTQTADNLGRVLNLGPLGAAAAGQAWYLLLSTAGLAGLGMIALIRSAVRVARRLGLSPDAEPPAPEPPHHESVGIRLTEPLSIVALIALIGVSFAVSAGFVTPASRPDQLVYGRYNDAFAPVLVIIGVAALTGALSWGRRALDAAVVFSAIALLALPLVFTQRELLSQPFNGFTISGILVVESAATRDIGGTATVGLTVTALVVAAGLLTTTQVRCTVVLVTIMILAGVGAVRSHARSDFSRQADPRTVLFLDTILEPGDRIAYPLEAGTSVGYYRYPFYIPDLRIELADDTVWRRRPGLVMAPATKAAAIEAGYRLAWVDPDTRMGLWVAPGARQDRLAAEHRLLPRSGVRPDVPDTGRVTLSGQPTYRDGRVRAHAVIHRPTTEPWPGIGRAAPAAGRIRLSVEVRDRSCGCLRAEPRVDLGGWITADRATVDVDVDLDMPLESGTYDLRFMLIREGVARFGTAATTELVV